MVAKLANTSSSKIAERQPRRTRLQPPLGFVCESQAAVLSESRSRFSLSDCQFGIQSKDLDAAAMAGAASYGMTIAAISSSSTSNASSPIS